MEMKIIELKASNIKRIKAVEIRPKDNVVVISGKNDQGKTSVLDSIWYALAGKDSLKNTPVPIRKGAKNAEAQLDLGDFLVTRKWTSNDKSYLEVTGKDGMREKSPQQLIDSFVGKLSFDPLEFANKKERDQREILLNLIDLDIDLDHVDNKIEVLYDQRRMKGQEVKLLQGEREEVTAEDLPVETVSISDLQEEYGTAMENNQRIYNAKDTIDEAKNRIMELEEEIERLKRAIEQNEKVIQESEFVNVSQIKNKIARAEEINEQIRAKKRNEEADQKLQKVQKEYDEFTKEIEDLKNQKVEALNKATMPIKGLGIDDNGITYNNLPFSQLSSSEKLKVSMAIAMAFNPRLRVIRITDGSLLDNGNMEIIKGMAKDTDFQVWIEKVSDEGKIGFYIEDGEVKIK
jgi:DNA repair exonuclease SbcCD ATPase subunit